MSYTIEHWVNRIAQRSDLSTGLVHLTRSSVIDDKEYNPLEIIIKILREKTLIASSPSSGFICGDKGALCFQESPLYSLSQNLYTEQQYRKQNSDAKIRYNPIGIMFDKQYIYQTGGRPVIYDDTQTAKTYLKPDEWWRIVRFDLSDSTNVIDWTHEREWRIAGDFYFDPSKATIILSNQRAYREFIKKCREIAEIDILLEIAGIVVLRAILF